MQTITYFSIFVSFLATWYMTRKWILKAPLIGLVGKDMNKPSKPEIPEMGGICVIFGFTVSLLMYIGLETFYLGTRNYLPLLGALCTMLLMCIIGMMDDILGWKKGIRQWKKPILTLFAAMPMMVINSGQSTMDLPILGNIDWGILYPLMIVPIGIVGASNVYNILAGYNGLEAGMGIIILSTLGYVGYITGNAQATVLAICMIGALLAFLKFNWYPAKVFPGDTLTYPVGALIACIAIIGNMEKIAILLFIPYVLDFILVLRKRFKAEAFAKINADGGLERPYNGIYHMVHLAIVLLTSVKSKVYERDVVAFMYGLELVLAFIILAAYEYKMF